MELPLYGGLKAGNYLHGLQPGISSKDRASQKYKLYFADLHFHTNYSDNRDRASIENMILGGRKYTIFL